VNDLVNREANRISQIQVEEDVKLFGDRNLTASERRSNKFSRIQEQFEDVDMTDLVEVSTELTQPGRFLQQRSDNVVRSSSSSDDKVLSANSLPTSAQPPIYAWLAQTVPPRDPESVAQWRDGEENRRSEIKSQELEGLEVFRNVQIAVSQEVDAPLLTEKVNMLPDQDLELGARIYYRNILDRYSVEPAIARRLAKGNWDRVNRLSPKAPKSANALEFPDEGYSTNLSNVFDAGKDKSRTQYRWEGPEMIIAQPDPVTSRNGKEAAANSLRNQFARDHGRTTFGDSTKAGTFDFSFPFFGSGDPFPSSFWDSQSPPFTSFLPKPLAPECPEKCPIITCGHHITGFSSTWARNDHTLSHYERIITCGFCTEDQNAYRGVEDLRAHLISVHNARVGLTGNFEFDVFAKAEAARMNRDAKRGKCVVCSVIFPSAQEFFDHLDDCIMMKVLQDEVYPHYIDNNDYQTIPAAVTATKPRKTMSLLPRPQDLELAEEPFCSTSKCYICETQITVRTRREWR
jgi:hypothetical protein